MKKILVMIAMLAVSIGIQAQKFHDVEANDAKGAVKTLAINLMGTEQSIGFSEDGKMESKGTTDIIYDDNGYIKSAKVDIRGQKIDVAYVWENGRVKSQSMTMMGQPMTITHQYNDKGENIADTIDVAGQVMETAYSDFAYDDHGNWISRKTQIMGQEVVQTRSFEYYK